MMEFGIPAFINHFNMTFYKYIVLAIIICFIDKFLVKKAGYKFLMRKIHMVLFVFSIVFIGCECLIDMAYIIGCLVTLQIVKLFVTIVALGIAGIFWFVYWIMLNSIVLGKN